MRRMEYENKDRKRGVSGIMRIKNDAQFIEASVASCISALDELIIVWNDCSDKSAEVIKEMSKRYPDKIRAFEYTPKIYSINLTREEYEYAKSLPNDSPHLLSNYYNFALSKIKYEFALKIDADQIYFTEKLKKWCDIYRSGSAACNYRVILGGFVWLYFKCMKNLGNKLGRLLPLFGKQIGGTLYKSYIEYAKYMISNHNFQVSLSGLNMVFVNKKWYVTIGKCTDIINILPPYNGTGDHLIFKATKNTYYKPFDSEDYNIQRSDRYSLIEQFVGDNYPIPVGTFWFHLNTMRPQALSKLEQVFKDNPSSFIDVEKFVNLDYYNDLDKQVDKKIASTNVRALFQFLHITEGSDDIVKNINQIKKFEKQNYGICLSNSSNL